MNLHIGTKCTNKGKKYIQKGGNSPRKRRDTVIQLCTYPSTKSRVMIHSHLTMPAVSWVWPLDGWETSVARIVWQAMVIALLSCLFCGVLMCGLIRKGVAGSGILGGQRCLQFRMESLLLLSTSIKC